MKCEGREGGREGGREERREGGRYLIGKSVLVSSI